MDAHYIEEPSLYALFSRIRTHHSNGLAAGRRFCLLDSLSMPSVTNVNLVVPFGTLLGALWVNTKNGTGKKKLSSHAFETSYVRLPATIALTVGMPSSKSLASS
jgi:hypothetical protein